MYFALLCWIARGLTRLTLHSLWLATNFVETSQQINAKEDSPTHRAKKKLVYYAWCITLVSMLILPFAAYVVAATFFTTFISFMIMDEM